MEPLKVLTDIEDYIRRRKVTRNDEVRLLIRNRNLIRNTLTNARGKEVNKDEVTQTIKWLEKVSNYIPIPSDKELVEIIKIMILLSEERAKLNELYDKPGLKLMKPVREGMIRHLVVLSELRALRKEYLEYWFTDEYWIAEWSRVLLDLSPNDNMVKYGFDNIKTKDFLFLLELELATADDASRLEKPMIRLQPIEDRDTFLIIPTESAAKEYKIQVDRIMDNKITFTRWISDTLEMLKLPK
ncbi:MAG: hypothetical protein ACFFAE_18270 [Candidatus Hodarchaeota archaeon]